MDAVGSGMERRRPADVLVGADRLRERVEEVGRALSEIFASEAHPPVLIGVLKGSTLFLADLVRAMDVDVEVDFMSISSYGEAGGVVRIVKDLDTDISGRHVVIVEDIVDTGLTLNYLRKTLGQRGPSSLRAVTLLDKVARRIVPVPLEFRCFEIPDVFVVGYGLDFQGLYRNSMAILAVRDVARLANEPHLLVGHLFGRGRDG